MRSLWISVPLLLTVCAATVRPQSVDRAKPAVAMLSCDFHIGSPVLGAGIVVGYDDNFLFIATANHVVKKPKAGDCKTRFYDLPGLSFAAEVADVEFPQLDLAVVRVRNWKQLGLDPQKWLAGTRLGAPDTLGTRSRLVAVGQANQTPWATSVPPERFISFEGTAIRFSGGSIDGGSSGGALLSEDGAFLGMVFAQKPAFAEALPLNVILRKLESERFPVALGDAARNRPPKTTDLLAAVYAAGVGRTIYDWVTQASDSDPAGIALVGLESTEAVLNASGILGISFSPSPDQARKSLPKVRADRVVAALAIAERWNAQVGTVGHPGEFLFDHFLVGSSIGAACLQIRENLIKDNGESILNTMGKLNLALTGTGDFNYLPVSVRSRFAVLIQDFEARPRTRANWLWFCSGLDSWLDGFREAADSNSDVQPSVGDSISPRSAPSSQGSAQSPSLNLLGLDKAMAADLGFQVQEWSIVAELDALRPSANTAAAVEAAEALIEKEAEMLHVALSPPARGRNKAMSRDRARRAQLIKTTAETWEKQIGVVLGAKELLVTPFLFGRFAGGMCSPMGTLATSFLVLGEAATALVAPGVEMMKLTADPIKQLLNDESIRAPKSLQDEFQGLLKRLDTPPPLSAKLWWDLDHDCSSWFGKLREHLMK